MTATEPASDNLRHPSRAHTVLVTVDVKPDKIEKFITGIAANAQSSLHGDYGCLAFHVHQDQQVPTRFYLHEIYSSREAFEIRHRSTGHYWDWRAVAAECITDGGLQITAADHIDTWRIAGIGPENGEN
ncbi:putative quinol monooxygenase [Nocardia sp. NPDC052112]|uniref:putative quinol monooxygenase n=1 Tax=Nocardia sp. NPDC052112 TaxID=3155646 RepID=UPI0034142EC5